MDYIDISMTIEPEMRVYKGDKEKAPEFKFLSTHKTGEVQETEVKMDLHTGTHIDSPLHMLKDGKTVDKFNFEEIMTSCKVLDLTSVTDGITADDLKEFEIEQEDFILLKTRNSFKNLPENFIYLEESGADFLVKKKIRGVGIDYLGIERSQPGHPTHKKILSAKITLVEGLELKGVDAGNYQLILAPLKFDGVEAAPARAFLIK
ncbi:MAG: cyclase family protein [Bacillota bacterium]